MDTTNKCPNCGNELSETSRFCDQCGSGIGAGSTVPAADSGVQPAGKRNGLIGLVIVFIAVIAGWWLLFGPQGGEQTKIATVPGSTAANPHGGSMGGGDMSNPHGGGAMGGDATGNPHGGDMGGAMGGDGMGNLTETLAAAKATLDENPLDAAALQTLYQSYGMIGRAGQLRPYLEAALAAVTAQELVKGEEALQAGKDVAVIALVGGDYDGSIMVLEGLSKTWPENTELKSMVGDAYASSDRFAEGIDWYTQYIDSGEAKDELYWSTRVKRARAMSMAATTDAENIDSAALAKAITEFAQITTEQPDMFQGWLGMGSALQLAGRTEEAVAAWEQAIAKTDDAMHRWSAESEIAKAQGKEAPPRPGMSAMGMGETPAT